jgi:hypothetical protein
MRQLKRSDAGKVIAENPYLAEGLLDFHKDRVRIGEGIPMLLPQGGPRETARRAVFGRN